MRFGRHWTQCGCWSALELEQALILCVDVGGAGLSWTEQG